MKGLVLSTEVAEWFDRRAEEIDDELLLRGSAHRWHQRLFERDLEMIRGFLELKKADYLLDVGCGNGLFLRAYAPHVKAAVGIDLSRKMLCRISAPDRRNLFAVQADGRALPFKAGSFDAILCNWVLHYLLPEELTEFFAEIGRVAKQKGRIFLGEIPLAASIRSWESKAGRYLLKKLRIRVSDRHISPVETARFSLQRIEEAAGEAGLWVISRGIMRHALPSLMVPPFGPLVPQRIQYLLARYDYQRAVPLLGHTCFFLLTTSGE